MEFLKTIKPNAIFAIALAANVMLQPSYPAAIIFVAFLAVVSYQNHLKQHDDAKAISGRITALFLRIDKIDRAIEAINSDVESVRKDHTEAHRVLEDAKKLLSQSNLAQAFTQKNGKRL